MKILVTGGAGFIGSNVVDGYIRAGHEVVVVDNLYTGRMENLNPRAGFYLMDVRAGELEKVFEIERPDVVNHHAAQMSVPASVEDPRFDADVNIMGILNLLENSVRYGVKKFIFISTGGAVYGEKEDLPTSEDAVPEPRSPYAITKYSSEIYLNYYRFQHGLDYTILRYANIYGPRQVPHGEAGVVAIFTRKMLSGELPTIYRYPDQEDGMTRDYCYVGDVVRANILALEGGSATVFNIGTGVETTTGELYRTVLGALRDEGIALDERFDTPNKGEARPGDLRRSALDYGRAERELGWSPEYDLIKGIRETVRYEIEQSVKGKGD
ncbi:MAG: NAD-dependent epimerase/dehydratase family protein [Nitrospirae bacterium]|nr:MAG: NAD-dependent epimerase/dehydratase family protein [Nitrospirota bacterium]